MESAMPRPPEPPAPAPETPGPPAERLARVATQFMGSTWALVVAGAVVALWFLTGVRYGFGSVRYELFEDVLTSVTFLMVFIIQRAQNKDTLAIHLKLDELVASSPQASNQLLNAEDVSESELERLHRRFEKLDAQARREGLTREPLCVDDVDADDDENDPVNHHARGPEGTQGGR